MNMGKKAAGIPDQWPSPEWAMVLSGDPTPVGSEIPSNCTIADQDENISDTANIDRGEVIADVEIAGWGQPSAGKAINRIAGLDEDILNLIFGNFELQLGLPAVVTQTRKSLFSAAQVCKAFVGPALNSLWRVLPSLLPLLLLLPSAEIVNDQYFVDDLPSSNWERFQMHARRVRTLYMEKSRVVISPIIYLRIRTLYDGPLLPGLKAIYIPDNNLVDFSSIMLLVSEASLEVVELNHNAISERNFFIPLLSSLASQTPQLGNLTLRGTGNTSISLEPLYRLTGLQRLELRLPGTYLYPQTVRRLGNLVNLQDLTLHAGALIPSPGIDKTQLSTPSNYRKSGKLRTLRIIGIISSITGILDDINLESLTTLVIDEMYENSRSHTKNFWMRCFDQISVCRAIENIEINMNPIKQPNLGNDNHDNSNYSLPTSWASSLLALNNMKSLVITGFAIPGSDEDFRLLACAFPKLTKLLVPPAYHSPGRTLASLFHFYQHCPDLSGIGICIAFDISRNLDAIKKLPLPISVDSRHPLKELHINSQFGPSVQPIHMILLAQFLNLLFPNLSILKAYDSNPTEIATWMGIQQFRVALEAARTNACQSLS